MWVSKGKRFSNGNIYKDGFASGVISLVCKNGLYDMKMGNLFCSLLAIPIISTIKIVSPLAS
jgi:hypothetical protein